MIDEQTILYKVREHRAINGSTYADARAAVENGWTPGELSVIEKLKICRCSMLRAKGFSTEVGFMDDVIDYVQNEPSADLAHKCGFNAGVALTEVRYKSAKTAEQPVDCRAAFEKWCKDNESTVVESYSDCWEAWQAAWQHNRVSI